MQKKFVDKAYGIFNLEKQKEYDPATLIEASEGTEGSESLLDKQLAILGGEAWKWVDIFFPSDSDLDGTPDWRDELHGTRDSVDKYYLGDGSIIAEVNNGVWAHFRSNGTQHDGFYSRSLSGMTSGDMSVGVTVGSSGVSASFTATLGNATYDFTPITQPGDIIVEGSPY